MMRVFGRSLPVSVSFLKSTFIFELHSESNADLFHISGCFCIFGSDFYEAANL